MKKANNINPNLSKFLPRILFSAIPVLLLSFLLSSELLSNSSAEQINVNIGDGAYTMSINASDVNVDIDADPAGTQRAVQEDVTITTSSGTGYKLYLSMNNSTSNNLYYNADPASSSYIAPTSSASSLSGLTMNSWGFSKNYNSSTGSGTWQAVPIQGSETLIASATTSPVGAVTHSIFYGFNVNNSLPFGRYTGTVIYTLVGDAAATPKATASVANFLDDKTMADPAGGDTLVITTSLMTNTTNVGDVSVTVGGTNCPVTNITTKSKFLEISCTAPAKTAGSYAVVASVPKFDKTYNTTLSYNADFYGAGMKKIRTMQAMTADVCNSKSTPSAFQSDGTTVNANVPEGKLRDTRDGNSYTVRKLADGHCWMSENLRLGSFTDEIVLTSNDSDVTSNYTLAVGRSDGCNSSYENCMYVSSTPSRGAYYTFNVATAGTGTATTSGETQVSVCPKGWKLPSHAETFGTDTGIFTSKYYDTYGANTTEARFNRMTSAPLSFVISGNQGSYHDNNSGYSDRTYGTNGYGIYWTSTITATSTNAYYIALNKTYGYYILPAGLFQTGMNSKYQAYTIRCISRY